MPATGAAGFLIGFLLGRNMKVFKIFLVLFLPVAWLIAKFAPDFFFVSRASAVKGWLTFYTQIYEEMDAVQQQAVHIFPILFLLGFILSRIYMRHFYREKVETLRQKKDRVRAYYGVNDLE